MRSGRLFDGLARLHGGSSAWRAGWTGLPGARGRSGRVSRRAAVRPVRAGRPGWWSCRSTSVRWPGRPAPGRTRSSGCRRVRVRRLRRWRRSGGRPAGTAGRRRAGRRAGAGRRRAGAGRWWRGWGRSRCRAARRRLRSGRRPRRGRVPGRVPGRRRPGRAPSGGAGVHWRSARASCSPHEASVFMRPRLGSCGGTFTDAAGRLKTSCSASRPVIGHAALADADLPARGILRLSAVCRSLTRARSGQLPHRAHPRVCRPGSWPLLP